MQRNYTLEYWIDDEWYVGRLREIPGVFSQGETLKELEENIKDAFELMTEENPQNLMRPDAQTKEITLEIR
jgi:predicted RNase H-like HicB family nuclease